MMFHQALKEEPCGTSPSLSFPHFPSLDHRISPLSFSLSSLLLSGLSVCMNLLFCLCIQLFCLYSPFSTFLYLKNDLSFCQSFSVHLYISLFSLPCSFCLSVSVSLLFFFLAVSQFLFMCLFSSLIFHSVSLILFISFCETVFLVPHLSLSLSVYLCGYL